MKHYSLLLLSIIIITSTSVAYAQGAQPSLSLGGSLSFVLINTEYVDGAACTSGTGDALDITTSGDAIDTSKVGVYSITYSCTDGSSDPVSASRTIVVFDNVPPKITINGSARQTININDVYVDKGATCHDNLEGMLSVTAKGAIFSTASSKIHDIVYSCYDSSGNTAHKTRAIYVNDPSPGAPLPTRPVDPTLPVIEISGHNPAKILQGQHYSDVGASCSDNKGTSLTVYISEYQVDTSTPGQGHVTYSCTDKDGNRVVKTRTVTVSDLPPVITLTGDAVVHVHLNTDWTDVGATCTDSGGATHPTTPRGDTVDTGVDGAYSITYDCIDSNGMPAVPVTRTVTVSDYEVPVVTLNGPDYVRLNIGDIYDEQRAQCTDDIDANPRLVIGGDTVSTSVAGQHVVKYLCIDDAGNEASLHRTIHVYDRSAPSITMNGLSEVRVNVGDTYEDAGATCYDGVDGDLSVMTIGLPISTKYITATYPYDVVYICFDSNSNYSIETRLVHVVQ